MLSHPIVAVEARAVQVNPSGLVIRLLAEELFEMATNKESCGDQHIEVHGTSRGVALAVHVIPSGLVITRFPGPALVDSETDTNKESSGDQHIEPHEWFTGVVRKVQVTPSLLVMTRLPAPLPATATNKDRCGDQQTAYQS
jgi:hypothetical protein